MKDLNFLTAISPIDGRYRSKTKELSQYFSEYALIKYRVFIEVRYLLALSDKKVIRRFVQKEKKILNNISEKFSLNDAKLVKKIESRINHDVKAVEYFIKEKIAKTSLSNISEFVHFALTSEDITNLSYSLILTDCLNNVYLPVLNKLIANLEKFARIHKNLPMLAHTHGQPATPTTLGKEFAVFISRLKNQLKTFPELSGKLNGAVGNYNAHVVSFPNVDWIAFSQTFIKQLNLRPNLLTTQVENHDTWAQTFHTIVRINNILLDLDRDVWMYIALDYLKQKGKIGEVGSSTMPHKINPIDFENSEGNVGIANSIFTHLAAKLPVSRLQRDLSDSTLIRNIGTAFGHSLLAIKSVLKGFEKITPNKKKISYDLMIHPEVIAEAIQIILRREGLPLPYERLKKLTRNKTVTLDALHLFIDRLKITDAIKKELKAITPDNYVGLARILVEKP